MAARGAEAKSKITELILQDFQGAFIASDGKTIRIPYTENGERVEVKVSLVAAKDCERGDAGEIETNITGDTPAVINETLAVAEPTEEEKAKVQKLMSVLNF